MPNKQFNSSMVWYIFKGLIIFISDSISEKVGILSISDKRYKFIDFLLLIIERNVLINLF